MQAAGMVITGLVRSEAKHGGTGVTTGGRGGNAVWKKLGTQLQPVHIPCPEWGDQRIEDRCVCVIAHANGGSRGPRKDRPCVCF